MLYGQYLDTLVGTVPNLTLSFKVSRIGGADHVPKFLCKVTSGDYTAGSIVSPSKKTAKADACKRLIEDEHFRAYVAANATRPMPKIAKTWIECEKESPDALIERLNAEQMQKFGTIPRVEITWSGGNCYSMIVWPRLDAETIYSSGYGHTEREATVGAYTNVNTVLENVHNWELEQEKAAQVEQEEAFKAELAMLAEEGGDDQSLDADGVDEDTVSLPDVQAMDAVHTNELRESISRVPEQDNLPDLTCLELLNDSEDEIESETGPFKTVGGLYVAPHLRHATQTGRIVDYQTIGGGLDISANQPNIKLERAPLENPPDSQVPISAPTDTELTPPPVVGMEWNESAEIPSTSNHVDSANTRYDEKWIARTKQVVQELEERILPLDVKPTVILDTTSETIVAAGYVSDVSSVLGITGEVEYPGQHVTSVMETSLRYGMEVELMMIKTVISCKLDHICYISNSPLAGNAVIMLRSLGYNIIHLATRDGVMRWVNDRRKWAMLDADDHFHPDRGPQ